MEKKKKKIEAPLVLRTGYEGGCKACAFLSHSVVLIADGTGVLFTYNYETSETLSQFEPSPGKQVFGIHKTNEFKDPKSSDFYSFLVVLYKDGIIDVFVLTRNGQLCLETENVERVYSVQSPLSLMMQVPKLERLFSHQFFKLLDVKDEEGTQGEEAEIDEISAMFEFIEGLDKKKTNGAINVVEVMENRLVFVGYESGLIKVLQYEVSDGRLTVLNKGYKLEGTAEEPPIILSILPIYEDVPENPSITLFVGSYTWSINVLKWDLSGLKQNEAVLSEETKQDSKTVKKASKKTSKLDLVKITPITAIESELLKPGVCELKYLQSQEWILIGSFDHRVRLYRIKKREKPRLVGLLKHHKLLINWIDFQFQANGICEVLVGSEDGSVTLWTLPF